MQAHYSTASRLAYITQSDQINQKTKQVHVGEATHSARLSLQLVLQLVSRYKRITTVMFTQNKGYDSKSCIYIKKTNRKNQHILRASHI